MRLKVSKVKAQENAETAKVSNDTLSCVAWRGGLWVNSSAPFFNMGSRQHEEGVDG